MRKIWKQKINLTGVLGGITTEPTKSEIAAETVKDQLRFREKQRERRISTGSVWLRTGSKGMDEDRNKVTQRTTEGVKEKRENENEKE